MAENTVTDIRQVSEPCPKCGSYYRRGDVCNICGAVAPEAEVEFTALGCAGMGCQGVLLHRKKQK